jgi:hypothetical protein
MDLPYDLVLAYLRDHLHFKMGDRELESAQLYLDKAAALELIPGRYQLT